MPLSKESQARLEALGSKFEAWASETFSEAKLSEAKLKARFWAAVAGAVFSGIVFARAAERLVELDQVANPRLVNEATLLELAKINIAIGGGFFFAFVCLAVFTGTTKGVWAWQRRPTPKTAAEEGADKTPQKALIKESRGPEDEGHRKKPDSAEDHSGNAFPSIWRGR